MATIELKVVAGTTATHTRTVTTAHLVRLIEAERALRNMPGSTDAQVLAEVAKSFFAYLRGRVREYEDRNAAETASAAVTDINLTNGA